MLIQKYTDEYKVVWDNFIDSAKNSSFLFKREFMDYHSDRFNDFSLMIFQNNQLFAVIPANLNKDILISHEGLSYGGIILHQKIRLVEVIEIVRDVLNYLNQNNIITWRLKCIPRMYHSRPSDEIDWITFKIKAKIYRRETALVIDNKSISLQYQERRRRSIKKATTKNVLIKKGFDQIKVFWENVLVPNLYTKHRVAPVHRIEEIELLAIRFPENIFQHNIYLNNEIVAGCTMFTNKHVAHAQYISGTDEGRESGCLDYLFDYLINIEYKNYDYFDFGTCNEEQGQIINKGLLDWKEGFGARTIIHDFYELNTYNVNILADFN